MEKTKLEKYAEIQAMVQKEARDIARQVYNEEATKYGVAQVPLHTHNGSDSPLIPSTNIVPGLRASGSIRFATTETRYKLNLSFKPSSILFYGNAVHVNEEEAIDIRAQVVGSAQLGPSYFFQPLDTSSVSPTDVVGNVIQSSSFLLVSSTGSPPLCLAQASEGHLVSVVYPNASTVVARATIPNLWTVAGGWTDFTDKGYGNGYIFVDVTLADGWEINGNFVVT